MRDWSPIVVCLVAAIGLFGCSSPRAGDPDATSLTGKEFAYPYSVVCSLPSDTIADIEKLSLQVAVPESSPSTENDELRRAYCEWYRTGYAFAFVTGTGYLRDWRYVADPRERAMVQGWFDGNSAGALARRLREIDSVFSQISSNFLQRQD
jgi:hypothetical protein